MAELVMKISHTVVRDIRIDLDDWYSYNKMTAREKFACIESCKDEFNELYIEGDKVDEVFDWDLMDWDIEE